MTVFVLEEVNHGTLAVVSSVRAAAEFLIKKYWLCPATDVWDDAKSDFAPISEVLGEDWADIVKNFTLSEFFDLFDDRFFLYQYEVDNF